MANQSNIEIHKECLEWLSGDDLKIIKRTTRKKLTTEQLGGYLRAANQAATNIIRQFDNRDEEYLITS